jgi:ATP-binding cassette subfamily F protein uup
MALLNLVNVSLAYGAAPLLDSVNLQIHAGERICLLGRNGSGKTSMMRMIQGVTDPDSGEIMREKDLRTAMLTQEIPDLQGTVGEIISGGSHSSIDRIISVMSLDPDLLFRNLSAGMKRRVLLGRALAADPDILLMDEPTNHLDMESIQWLEDFLSRYDKTVFFVTHDRMFLQKIARRILELDRGRLSDWKCDYRTYLERKDALLEAEETQNALFDKKLAQEEAWVRRGVKARRTRNEGRVRALLEMRKQRAERRELQGNVSMKVNEGEKSGKLVMEAQDISFHYGDGIEIIKEFSTTIQRGDRVGVMGPNGCGKSTLIRLLLEQLAPSSGAVRTGTRVQAAYFDQLKEKLDETKTVRDNLSGTGEFIEAGGKKKHVMGYLQDFLFTPDRIMQPVKALSGGEKNRLMLAKLFAQPANLLIMDEPTNDLDLETVELLEELLVEYGGTLLLVSHDRAFINNVVTSTIVFEGNGVLREYAGGYDDWLYQRKAPAAEKPRAEKKIPVKPAADPQDKKKLSFREKKELESLPGLLEEKEKRKADIFAALADPSLYKESGDSVNSLRLELESLESELHVLYQRWEELESRIGE